MANGTHRRRRAGSQGMSKLRLACWDCAWWDS